jgi:lipoyl(octanoyl) transferase
MSASDASDAITVRDWGRCDYARVWQAMKAFTDDRDADTPDEIWQVEHPAVFTLGQAGRAEHVLDAGDIPLVQTDRGGQVTYHGPGQIVLYPLIDLRRQRLGARDLVTRLERSVVAWLARQGIESAPRADAPGVYVNDAKIAALGLRIRRGCSYHGLAVNIAMDRAPFDRINPCGYAGMAVTDLASLGVECSMADAREGLTQAVVDQLSLT